MSVRQVCLLYPPLSVHEFPHMALPLLKGFLVSAGVTEVSVKDANVEIMASLLKSRWGRIEDYFLSRGTKLTVSDVEKNLSLAWAILADKTGRGKDEWAFAIINTYLKIAGMNISEVCFSPGSFDEIKKKYQSTNIDGDPNPIIEYIRNTLIPYLRDHPAHVVGISVPFGSQLYYALLIGRELKKRFADTQVILGGPQISLFWKVIVKHEPFRQSYDALVYGDGELALLEYIRQSRGDQNLHQVPNLIYFDQAGTLAVNPEKVLPNIREIAAPDFGDLPLDRYAYPKLPYFLSRGCYWRRCAFCSYRNTKGYSSKTSDRVVADLKAMRGKYSRRLYHFIDDSIHPNLIKQVANKLIETNLNIKYEAYMRLDPRFTPDLCRRIGQSGMRSALFGLESGNLRVLRKMNKGIDLDDAVAVLSNMKEAGVKSVISCLFGFPSETRDEAWDSVRFLQKTRELYSQAFLVHYGLISDMSEHMEDYGITKVDLTNPVRYDDTGFVALGYPYETCCGMSQQEALTVLKQAREALGIQMFSDCFFS